MLNAIKYEQFTSKELVKLLVDKANLIENDNPTGANVVEVSLINGAIKATHRMFVEDGMVFDTGIDDEEAEYTIEEWLALYPRANWYIDRKEYDWLIGDKSYVCFTVCAGAVFDQKFKVMTFEQAITKALKIVKKIFGKDCENRREILKEAEEELRRRRYWSDENEMDIYIRYVEK